MKLSVFVLSTSLALLSTVVHAGIGYADVLGKTFITSAGSSSGSFIMSTSITTKTRNTVEVKFVESDISWSGGDISAINSDLKAADLIAVMINCREKTYTPSQFAKDGYSFRTYQSGSAYKWGSYQTGEIINGSNDGPILTKYFQTVCAYSAQF